MIIENQVTGEKYELIKLKEQVFSNCEKCDLTLRREKDFCFSQNLEDEKGRFPAEFCNNVTGKQTVWKKVNLFKKILKEGRNKDEDIKMD